jgi:hypothetical protein
MSHGKSQFTTWYCKEEREVKGRGKAKDTVSMKPCNTAHQSITAYDKRRDSEIAKELSLFCPKCRKHTNHKRKDTRKGSAS